ncbi:S53 family peptidase [Lacisediminihabitans profunda]|uniref:S8/S53 family peptidase n=1 Tax=Lacisediminihabitans profunda TaxID=2594790 RepID=A0A5C8UR36_9MICO|nr:S53 family peptidase [Lacisediminihabitans profunda]TXN31041.1 S8/S53 family peptidase [Lacisediminihabitans profunda]
MTIFARPGASSRRIVAIVATAAAVVALSFTGVSAATAADRVPFSGSVPSWAKTANDAGAPAADTTVEGEIYLPLRNAAAAEALAVAVSTPGARGYRQALTPQQWIQRFSPTQADLNEVVNYLTAQGLTISAVPASRQFVVFRGTAAQLNAGFATDLHTYNYAGQSLVAPAAAPSVPAALGAKVSGVSLDQARFLTRPHSIRQGDLGAADGVRAFGRQAAVTPTIPAPCSTYIGENTVTVPQVYGETQLSTNICGYTPAQLRSAYGLDSLAKSGVNGAGQTVAILDAYASPSIVSDVNTYSAALGEPGLTSATYQHIVPAPSEFKDQAACGFPSGWQGEQTLDVESVHGIAPGARILYVGAFNCGGGLDVALAKVLDNKLATIVSNSYGNLGEAIPFDALKGAENLHIQAAGEGIGLYFSSGDNGDEVANLGFASPDFPASSPYVTAVGGTSLGIDKAGKIALETGWGDTADVITSTAGVLAYTETPPGTLFLGGAGGGTSGVFKAPAYQRGIVPASQAKGYRVSPDIAALADPYTGFSIGISPIVDDTSLETGAFERDTYGGTSLASPIVAAQIAIVQQATHTSIGFANPTLYGLDRVLPSSFRDVLPQDPRQALVYTSARSGRSFLISLDTDTSLTTAKRYDNVTGIGGVTFGLLTLLAQGRH